jgi:hypothetical protein
VTPELGSAIGDTASGFCFFAFLFLACASEPAGLFTVTVGVMYVGDASGFVGPTGELVVDLLFCDFSSFVLLFVALDELFVSCVVPASEDRDAFVAMTGATGMATNGTAVSAAKMHATVAFTVLCMRRGCASKD